MEGNLYLAFVHLARVLLTVLNLSCLNSSPISPKARWRKGALFLFIDNLGQ